jgi:hypothetical protein
MSGEYQGGENACQERVKKFTFKQGYLAQRRRGAESTKKIKQLFNSNLCVSKSLREIVHFFTRSGHHISDFFSGILTLAASFRLTFHVAQAGAAEGQWPVVGG